MVESRFPVPPALVLGALEAERHEFALFSVTGAPRRAAELRRTPGGVRLVLFQCPARPAARRRSP